MRDIIIGIGFLIILAAPIVALGWLIYRLIKGSGGNDYSIK
jgi:hypothetical protein